TSETFNCRLRTISEVIEAEGIEQIDLLKIDVEKSEQDVLAGINEKDWPKIKQIVVEVHDLEGRLEKLTNLLIEKGYLLAIDQDNSQKNTQLYNIYATKVVRDGNGDATGNNNTASINQFTWNSPIALERDLRSSLKKALPEYMVPSAF